MADRLDELPVSPIERVLRPLDRRKRIAGSKADVNLLADRLSVKSRRQVVDHRSRGIDLEARADTLSIERLSGRMGRRIGGDDLHRVAAVRQEAGVERIVAVGEVR